VICLHVIANLHTSVSFYSHEILNAMQVLIRNQLCSRFHPNVVLQVLRQIRCSHCHSRFRSTCLFPLLLLTIPFLPSTSTLLLNLIIPPLEVIFRLLIRQQLLHNRLLSILLLDSRTKEFCRRLNNRTHLQLIQSRRGITWKYFGRVFAEAR
jgi:hypothetical protein